MDNYGELSYDHQSYFSGPLGRKAKQLYYKNSMLGTIAVAPMVLSEAFIPSARGLFWRPQRLPIADAHYAMGFAFLSEKSSNSKHYDNAVHFLDVLKQTRCKDYEHFCWGYPFDWVTKKGTIPPHTPLITTAPYSYEAFSQVYQIDQNQKWLEVMQSIAEHGLNDIREYEVYPGMATCAYGPHDKEGGVINASAYRAFLLTSASIQFSNDNYLQAAERNLNFVLHSQQPNGSWYYSIGGNRDFVDHFHTCFVLKALAKIENLTGHEGCRHAIDKGIDYYLSELFDDEGLPKPFSKAPRLTVYLRELYDYAECINLCVLLRSRYSELDTILSTVLHDLLTRWQKRDGSFRSRKLFLGWDNVPMHRWAQSQLFRSLCFLTTDEEQTDQ